MAGTGDFPILETSRLLLREIVAGDAPSLFAVYADQKHMQWYGIEPFPDLAAAEARIKTFSTMRAQGGPLDYTSKSHGRICLIS